MDRGPEPGWERDPPALYDAARQLRAYFAGELREFDLALERRADRLDLS